jgi:hypothetical protein
MSLRAPSLRAVAGGSLRGLALALALTAGGGCAQEMEHGQNPDAAANSDAGGNLPDGAPGGDAAPPCDAGIGDAGADGGLVDAGADGGLLDGGLFDAGPDGGGRGPRDAGPPCR